ncbi:MAG: tyrosine--tRNA ligase, partial [Deltaproteobacteria bacterium]|nr:tyrosine--tRNA ligase [Deltaproteobacteria bacterium]
DQKFNLVVARDILRAYGMEPEIVLLMPLLVGTDGQKKMSKSYGNYIGISEPPKEIFGKIMSITDELMEHYYELLTEENLDEIKKLHPKEAKIRLAKILVTRFYSKQEAIEAALEFEKVFAQKSKPTDIEEKTIKKSGSEMSVVEILLTSGLVASKGEARRLIEQGGVRVDDQRVEEIDVTLKTNGSYLIQLGKRRFLKVRFK